MIYYYLSILTIQSIEDEATALGIGSGTIPDSQLSESNCSSNDDHCAIWGRLDASKSTWCWMPLASAVDPWLQVGIRIQF